MILPPLSFSPQRDIHKKLRGTFSSLPIGVQFTWTSARYHYPLLPRVTRHQTVGQFPPEKRFEPLVISTLLLPGKDWAKVAPVTPPHVSDKFPGAFDPNEHAASHSLSTYGWSDLQWPPTNHVRTCLTLQQMDIFPPR